MNVTPWPMVSHVKGAIKNAAGTIGRFRLFMPSNAVRRYSKFVDIQTYLRVLFKGQCSSGAVHK